MELVPDSINVFLCVDIQFSVVVKECDIQVYEFMVILRLSY